MYRLVPDSQPSLDVEVEGSSRSVGCQKNLNLNIAFDFRVALERPLTFPSYRFPRRSPLPCCP